MSWIRSLDALEPDLVVNTGDSIAHPDAVQPFLDSLGPLLDRPGVFVYGSNDLYSPVPKNPAALPVAGQQPGAPAAHPGPALGRAGRRDGGRRLAGRQQPAGPGQAGDLDIGRRGPRLPHQRDRYEDIAGPADPSADLRLGVLHSPEPRVLDQFAADGYDLLLAGHTHGGQLRIPLYGALVTNCGIDRERVSGLHRHPAAAPEPGSLQALAARFGRARYLALGPGPDRLPAGGHAAHAGAADRLDCRRFRGNRPPGVLGPRTGRRGVAQLGSALRSGRRGRRFKSGHPDHVFAVRARFHDTGAGFLDR